MKRASRWGAVRAGVACGALGTLLALLFQPPTRPEHHRMLAGYPSDPRGVVVAWERAAAADPAAAPVRDVLRGLVAAARGEAAMVLASGPDPPPAAFDRPIEAFAAALEAFADAVVATADADPVGAVARRDAERAWLRLQGLRAAQEEARQRRRDDPPPPPEQGDAQDGEGGDETRVAAVTEALPAGAVAGLLDRLREKQEEKRATRREARVSGAGGDW